MGGTKSISVTSNYCYINLPSSAYGHREETSGLESKLKRRNTEMEALDNFPKLTERSQPVTNSFPIVEDSDSEEREGLWRIDDDLLR